MKRRRLGIDLAPLLKRALTPASTGRERVAIEALVLTDRDRIKTLRWVHWVDDNGVESSPGIACRL